MMPPSMVLGENGDPALSAAGLGDPMLAFFDKLLRGLPEDRARQFVAEVLREPGADRSVAARNLLVLAFQTRWCRGGKGEKTAAFVLLKVLYESFPGAVLGLVEQLPAYGSWKDPLALLLECHHRGRGDYSALRQRVWTLFAGQLEADWAELQAARAEGRAPLALSLCAKFAPSEGGEHSRVLGADKQICALLFPAVVGAQVAVGDAAWHHARGRYRKMLSALRRALAVPEVGMCAKRWAAIDFAQVPSLCMDRSKRAFLNETKQGEPLHPGDADRVACREHLLAAVAERGVAALKGKQLFPHELVMQVLQAKGGVLSTGIEHVLNAQWEAVRAGLLEMVAGRKQELAERARPLDDASALAGAAALLHLRSMREGLQNHTTHIEQMRDGLQNHSTHAVQALGIARDVAVGAAVAAGSARPTGLAKMVAMADVSGSMSGVPMHVSIALGLLVSEVSHPAFRNKVMTFESKPKWHDLSAETSFVGKARSLAGASWGGTTDFAAAMGLILAMVRERKLEQHDVPDLLVISDMQFDEAVEDERLWGGGFGWGGPTTWPAGSPNALRAAKAAEAAAVKGGWKGTHAKIAAQFHELGLELHGRPLDAPGIIFWNVNSGSVGYPAAADQPGVMLLSGYSPALMKFVLSGEMEQETAVGVDEQGNAVLAKTQVDPRETLARVLNDPGLDAVRAALDSMPPAYFE